MNTADVLAFTTDDLPISRLGGTPVSLRYVDPGYAIRSVGANAYDAVYCLRLAQAAAHAAMAGFTSTVGMSVLETTGQTLAF